VQPASTGPSSGTQQPSGAGSNAPLLTFHCLCAKVSSKYPPFPADMASVGSREYATAPANVSPSDLTSPSLTNKGIRRGPGGRSSVSPVLRCTGSLRAELDLPYEASSLGLGGGGGGRGTAGIPLMLYS